MGALFLATVKHLFRKPLEGVSHLPVPVVGEDLSLIHI